MAWCDGYEKSLTVDHKDCDNRNNAADNLQWVTRAENIKLAHKKGVYVYRECGLIGEDGTELRFNSFAEASCYLGRSIKYISCIVNQKQRCDAKDKDGNTYKVVVYKNNKERS
ncbi:MAG: HNH endonuclease [Clostridia bacterium]|nr:HNH endonuclease [Clostridia bacterium]